MVVRVHKLKEGKQYTLCALGNGEKVDTLDFLEEMKGKRAKEIDKLNLVNRFKCFYIVSFVGFVIIYNQSSRFFRYRLVFIKGIYSKFFTFHLNIYLSHFPRGNT